MESKFKRFIILKEFIKLGRQLYINLYNGF